MSLHLRLSLREAPDEMDTRRSNWSIDPLAIDVLSGESSQTSIWTTCADMADCTDAAPRNIREEQTKMNGEWTPEEGSPRNHLERSPTIRNDVQVTTFDDQASELRRKARACLHHLGVSESDVLITSLMHALIEENPNTPRAKTLDTVLVLDCSDSMGADGMAAMKKSALDFLGAIEDVAVERKLEENVAVVAMGNGARIVQHLTNDYERVRCAIESLTLGGLSPLFEALCVAVAEARNLGGAVIASGCHKILPRVILFTDGRATHEIRDDGDDFRPADVQVRIRLIRLLQHIEQLSSAPRPLVWVPVGNSPNKEFLTSIAKLCNGSDTFVEPLNICRVSEYYLIQDTVGKVYSCAKDSGWGREQVEVIIPALAENLSPQQKTRVVDAVMEKMETKSLKGEGRPTDWDNVQERSELPPLGSRVIRGPDWKWQNQDTEGAGTIINHDEDRRLVWVTWDNGTTNCYRCGLQDAYDILPVDNEKCPRGLMPGDSIDIGCTVVRGPDWNRQEEEGESEQTGVVIRKRKDGLVKVRWQNGHINDHRYGKDGKYDVKISDAGGSNDQPETVVHALPVEDWLPVAPDEPVCSVWRWRDKNTDWKEFDEETSSRIEGAFSKNTRSCVITHQGTTFRVIFSQMHARPCDNKGDTSSVEVRRDVG